MSTIPRLDFDRVWTDPDAFPLSTMNEDTVRGYYQYHYDAIKTYINETLRPGLDELLKGGNSDG